MINIAIAYLLVNDQIVFWSTKLIKYQREGMRRNVMAATRNSKFLHLLSQKDVNVNEDFYQFTGFWWKSDGWWTTGEYDGKIDGRNEKWKRLLIQQERGRGFISELYWWWMKTVKVKLILPLGIRVNKRRRRHLGRVMES